MIPSPTPTGVASECTPSGRWSRRACAGLLTAALLLSLLGCQPERTLPALAPGTTVLALGDSITHGTGASAGQDWPRLLAELTGWDIVNAGVPGDTAQHARTRIGALLAQHQPVMVIVELGGNDFLRRRSPELVKEDLRDIVRQARAHGAQVALMAVPAPSLLGAVVSRLSDAPLYQALAAEEGAVLVEDVISTVLSDEGLRADPIHPNAEGYRQMAQALHRRFQALGWAGG